MQNEINQMHICATGGTENTGLWSIGPNAQMTLRKKWPAKQSSVNQRLPTLFNSLNIAF